MEEDRSSGLQLNLDKTHKEIQENIERILALNDNFESLYDVDLDTGEYEEYIKGHTYTEQIKTRFVEKGDFFEDTYRNAEHVFYPDDIPGLKKVLNPKAIRRALKKESHFDWNYRLMIDGIPNWFRLRVVYKNAEQKRVIIGIFNAEEEIAIREREDQFKKELFNRMVGDDGLFLIDCANDTRKTIHDHCHGAKEYTDNESYTEIIARYVDNCVIESDREMMRRATSPAGMLERVSEENEYTIDYRDITGGVQRFYRMKIAKLSDTEVLQSFAEMDKHIINKLIFNQMEGEYFALLVVDVDAAMVKTIKNNSSYPMGQVGKAAGYTRIIKKFAEQLPKEPQTFFNTIADIEHVRKELSTEDKHTYSFRTNDTEDSSWVDVTSYVILRNDDGSPAMFTLGFSLTDSLRAGRHELERRLKEDMEMIGGLASGYHALYYYNMDEHVFKIYSIDGKRVDELKQVVSEDGDPVQMIMKFGFSDLVHPDDRWLFENLSVEGVRVQLAHKKRFSLRFRRNVDGRYLWTEMDVIKYEDIHERPNVIAIGFAIRDEEIRNEFEQQRKLQEALEAAEIANRSKSSFLFNMSHDIRTPMNAIRGFTTMAKKYMDDKEKTKEYLDKIDISGSQLLALINQVLEMARIESGKIDFDEKPVNINKEFSSMITVLSEQAAAAGLEFHYAFQDVVHSNVLADGARMGSIALNIAGNAMKYTPEGGRIDYIFQEVPSRREGYASYKFTVADTGIGMSEEFQKQLFEPFSRENNSTVSKIQGTGLGMSIVKSLVDLMGGTIEVHSQLGHGTRFEITVDLRIDTEKRTQAEPEEQISAVSFEGRRLLLVEDNEMNREIAKNIFEEGGFIVDEASDGDVAVAIMQRMVDHNKPDYYDCILMDVQMPRMNGYEATKAIRKLLKGQKERIPIIAMTANAFEEDRTDALAAGMDEHLAKPIDVRKCFDTLAHFLK